MSYNFPPLQGKIVNPDGTPTQAFTVYWQNFRTNLAEALEGLADAVEAVALAQAAANTAQAAAVTANAAAAAATTAAADANAAIADIEAGDFELEAVNIGGTRFINNGGVLEPEP